MFLLYGPTSCWFPQVSSEVPLHAEKELLPFPLWFVPSLVVPCIGPTQRPIGKKASK